MPSLHPGLETLKAGVSKTENQVTSVEGFCEAVCPRAGRDSSALVSSDAESGCFEPVGAP